MAMAAALASGIVHSVLLKLGHSILEELVQTGCFNVGAGVKELGSKLATIQAVLAEAEERSTRDKLLSDWLKKLKDAAYDIDDLIDEIQSDNQAVKGTKSVRNFFSFSNPILNRIAVYWKIKMLKKKLDEIATERIQFNLSPKGGQTTQFELVGNRETISKVDESKIIGRGDDKEAIMKMVLDTTCEEDISVIPIVGIGGLGKTTLAQLVFHDKRANDEVFGPRIWVSVSQNFKLQTIVAPILAATKKKFDLNNLQAVAEFLYRTFTGKKYLLVLDDVWNENQQEWDRLKLLLQDGKRGSKIIVTTRSKRVAMMMRTVPPFSLRGLSDDDCWELFKLKAFEKGEEELYPNLIEIGREIVKKCGGVPLAANALGSMLRFKREPVSWEAVRDCEIWQLENEDILPSLMLSYEQMPADLKQCFAYCSIFPKNYEIEKEKLIQQWAALGFIDLGKQPNRPKEDKGNEYFNHLLWMSFIQDLEDDESAKFGAKYAMHHLVYELVQSISGEEIQFINLDEQINNALDFCRYVSVRNGVNPVPRSLLRKVRALHFRDGPLHSEFMNHLNRLRVLDLHGSQAKELPEFMRTLKHLRYLDLSSSCVENLPKSIYKMPNLETIYLSNCLNLKGLPNSIGLLKNLQNLNLAACNLVSLPESLGSLRNLKNLDLSSCSYLKELPESIQELTKLQSLNLEACSNLLILPQSIGNLQNLQSLNLSQCGLLCSLPESLGNLLNLLILNLSLCNDMKELPESIGRLKKLQTLDLSECNGLLNLPESIGDLQGLQILNISHNSSLEILPLSLDYLKNLQTLNLSMNLELKALPDSIGCLLNLRALILFHCWSLQILPSSITKLSKLETLNLVGCEELKELPNLTAYNNMVNLRHLINNQCRSLQGLPLGFRYLHKLEMLPLFIASQDVDRYSSIAELENLNLLSGNLEIKFYGCEKSLIDDVAMARINEKEKLQSLTLTWPSSDTKSDESEMLLEKLLPPPSLEVLHINGYTGRVFSGWMSNDSLPKLVDLQLSNIPNCSSIPPLGRLQFLQFIELQHLTGLRTICLDSFDNGEQRVVLYPSLKEIHFENLPNLEKWPSTITANNGVEEAMKVFMFPKLLKVTAIECPKVMPDPYLPPSVTDLIVTESSEMLSSRGPAGLYSPSLLRRLWIRNCVVLSSNWCALEYLSKLENLTIENCDDLRSFPVSMRYLVMLKHLKVVECNNFEGLPEWIGDLATLESLEIICCPKLVHLPQSLQNLTALDEIIITNCSESLKEKCEKDTGEDWYKIHHVRNISIS